VNAARGAKRLECGALTAALPLHVVAEPVALKAALKTRAIQTRCVVRC
jgi:hypothetical protein